MAAGLLAFSCRQFALTINQTWTFSYSASHYFSFLAIRSGRRMPPAERSALYNLQHTTCTMKHWKQQVAQRSGAVSCEHK